MDHFADIGNPENLARPQAIGTIEHAEIERLLKQHKLSREEFQKILQILGRAPTMAELGVFSAMWSEHCSYKSSKVHLRRFPTKGPRVVVGPGENAGVVELENGLCVAFKMESHNHPSYIEPYQGAATGVGGILRDVFCMGAKPIANLNCLRFGRHQHPRTQYIASRVVQGIGDYGNCVGVPTVGGSVSFDSTYDGNCLVNAMSVGLIHRDKIFKGFASGVGNYVIYVGSATGRDGVHGATMASDAFTESSDPSKTTVQVGDPFAEKLLLEATLEVLAKNLVIGIQDMGAAGLTSSSFEMAGRAGNGILIDLDRVPLRTTNMSAYEIMLSESQERMLMVVAPEKWEQLASVLQRWQLPHAVIGLVTHSGRMQIHYQGLLEIDLPVLPLTDEAPVYERPLGPKISRTKSSQDLTRLEQNLSEDHHFAADIFKKMLRESGSKKEIFEQFDRHVGARTVLDSGSGGAAVLWIRTDETRHKPYLGISLTSGCNERRVQNNPHHGSAEAVRDCAREIVASGGVPLAVTDCLNFGNADDPVVMRQFSDCVDGISEACSALGTPVVSGNVSLFNATGNRSIYPTPMIGMVGHVSDVRASTPAIIKDGEDVSLFTLMPTGSSELTFSASLAAKVAGISPDEGSIASINWQDEKNLYHSLGLIRSDGALVAARPIGEGGVGIAIFKMLSNMIHQGIHLEITAKSPLDFFGEGGARFLICIQEAQIEQLRSALDKNGMMIELVARAKKVKPQENTLRDQKSQSQLLSYFGRFSLQDFLGAYERFLTREVM